MVWLHKLQKGFFGHDDLLSLSLIFLFHFSSSFFLSFLSFFTLGWTFTKLLFKETKSNYKRKFFYSSNIPSNASISFHNISISTFLLTILSTMHQQCINSSSSIGLMSLTLQMAFAFLFPLDVSLDFVFGNFEGPAIGSIALTALIGWIRTIKQVKILLAMFQKATN